MVLKFVTGNKTKLAEVRKILDPIDVEQVNIDLDEIQEIDPHKIIRHKLREALRLQDGEFVIEDSSMYMDALGGKLPGPLIKWFNDTIGTKGLAEVASKMGNNKARALTVVGYAKNPKEIFFFEGSLEGNIVQPKGDYNFGYDPIFVPANDNKTLAEHKAGGNFNFSPRGVAFQKLKEYLLKD